MSDYSTSTTPDETRYQENTPTVTPEIVDDIDDADLVETRWGSLKRVLAEKRGPKFI